MDTPEFKDPFAEAIANLDSPQARLGRLLWEMGEKPGMNADMGEARLVGYLIVTEYELPSGGLATRAHAGTNGEKPIMWWRARALQSVAADLIDDIKVAQQTSMAEGDDEE